MTVAPACRRSFGSFFLRRLISKRVTIVRVLLWGKDGERIPRRSQNSGILEYNVERNEFIFSEQRSANYSKRSVTTMFHTCCNPD